MDDSDSEVQELIKKTSLIHNKSKTDDSSESEDDAENEPKRERKNYQYSFVKEYDNYVVATQEIETMKIKGHTMKKKRSFGDKREFYCRKGCPVYMYLRLHSDSEKCSLYVTENEHIHNEKKPKNKLPENTREKAIELLDLRKIKKNLIFINLFKLFLKYLDIPPAEIIKRIRDDPVLDQIEKKQLYNLSARNKVTNLGKVIIDFMELIDLCNSMTSVPTDVDQVYDWRVKILTVHYLILTFV